MKVFYFQFWQQSAHSDVNAGLNFNIDVDQNFLVKSKPTIVFGGISKTFVSIYLCYILYFFSIFKYLFRFQSKIYLCLFYLYVLVLYRKNNFLSLTEGTRNKDRRILDWESTWWSRYTERYVLISNGRHTCTCTYISVPGI